MPSTRCEAEFFADLDALPSDALALFADGREFTGPDRFPGCFYDTAGWYRLVCAAAVPPGAAAVFVVIRRGGRAIVVFPLLRLANGAHASLTTPYSCLYRPLAGEGIDGAGWNAVGRALARFCRSGLRLDALDGELPGLDALCDGLRGGFLVPLRFAHFGNWHAVAGGSWAAYLAGRDGILRETIRRRTAACARDPAVRFDLLRDTGALEIGIAAFETVYARSWKEPEPFPTFNAGLIRLAAAQGVLRLGVMWHGETPVAVQLWIVAGGVASVLKLAHDEEFRRLSPGTVLTAWMIRGFFEAEGLTALDFGRGDDTYKRAWVGDRRQRIGIECISPWRTGGLALLSRHLLGGLRRRLLHRDTKMS